MYWVVSWQWFQRLSMQCQRWNYIWIGNHKPYLLGCGGNPSNHHQLPYNDEIIFRWQYPHKHYLYCNHFHYLHMLKNLLVLVRLSGFNAKEDFVYSFDALLVLIFTGYSQMTNGGGVALVPVAYFQQPDGRIGAVDPATVFSKCRCHEEEPFY